MKRFIAALLAVAVFAEDDEVAATEDDTTGETPVDGKGKEVASAVGDWFSSRTD